MDHPKSTNSLETENIEEKHGATTSKINYSNPESSSHNMNDLKMFDFNSADEVRSAREHSTGQINDSAPIFVKPVRGVPFSIRQAMKAMLGSGNKPQNSGDEMKPQTTKAVASKNNIIDVKNQNMAGNVFKIVNSKEERAFSSNVRKKRPGRPPNAGPSKKMKRVSVTNMFVGKLTNVVQFKNYASESESDDYFY